jgi:hypothetical protein
MAFVVMAFVVMAFVVMASVVMTSVVTGSGAIALGQHRSDHDRCCASALSERVKAR